MAKKKKDEPKFDAMVWIDNEIDKCQDINFDRDAEAESIKQSLIAGDYNYCLTKEQVIEVVCYCTRSDEMAETLARINHNRK